MASIRIKRDHTHGDKVCYVVSGGTIEERAPADLPPFSSWYRDSRRAVVDVSMVVLGREECIVGYRVYTGHWYAWDPETGEEVATMTRAFYDRHIAGALQVPLLPDPDCLVRS